MFMQSKYYAHDNALETRGVVVSRKSREQLVIEGTRVVV